MLSKFCQLTLLLLLGGLGGILADEDDVVIIPLRTYLCEGAEPLLDYDVSIHVLNDEGDKSLDAEMEFDEDFNAQWTFILKIDQWNNGDWDEHFYDADGPICYMINQYVSRAWKRLRDEIEPAIEEDCHVGPGKYKLSTFNVSKTDYDIPVAILGTYRVMGRILDEYGNELICQMLEVETDKAR